MFSRSIENHGGVLTQQHVGTSSVVITGPSCFHFCRVVLPLLVGWVSPMVGGVLTMVWVFREQQRLPTINDAF